MPPAKSREQEVPEHVTAPPGPRVGPIGDTQVIWYAFRAFDVDDEKEVTVEKVLQAARLLEARA